MELPARQAEILEHLHAAGALTTGMIARLLNIKVTKARKALIALKTRRLVIAQNCNNGTKDFRIWSYGVADPEKAIAYGALYTKLKTEQPGWLFSLDASYAVFNSDGKSYKTAYLKNGQVRKADIFIIKDKSQIALLPNGSKFVFADVLFSDKPLTKNIYKKKGGG